MSRWVYGFGAGKTEGKAAMRDLLGGKGANLAEMCQLGLAVPPGFTLTTEVCRHYQDGQRYPDDLEAQVAAALRAVTEMDLDSSAIKCKLTSVPSSP
jgi:pyruvate,orthophosphate dikinase